MKNTSRNVIDILEKISDFKFQKEVWLEGKYWNRVSSFEEAVNTLEDYNFFTDVDENKIGLTENEKNKTKIFINKLMQYESENCSDMLIDPIWKNIVNDANEIFLIIKKYTW